MHSSSVHWPALDRQPCGKRTRSTLLLLLTLAAMTTACGGGGGGGTEATPRAETALEGTSTADVSSPVLVAAAGNSIVANANPLPEDGCLVVASLPAPPSSGVLRVVDFGATPNDEDDDTAAIQAAVNAAMPGDWVVFQPGRYLQSTTINVIRRGVTLYGAGATIHATNPDSQAIQIKADDVAVYGFTLTANTQSRRSEPWTTRISTFGRDTLKGYISGVKIRNNSIVPKDEASGLDGSNSASAAGILIHSTRDFTVEGNTVRRSLSDGIHVTGGSRNGRVLNNDVLETGDDGIAVVSYLPNEWRSVIDSQQTLESAAGIRLTRDILISNNRVSNQYWGRGVAVVGGDSVTIVGNQVQRQSMAAGIIVAREESNNTFGSSNVLISRNSVSLIQVASPSYFPSGQYATKLLSLTAVDGGKTKQGGIEIHSNFVASDLDVLYKMYAVQVREILVDGNVISDVVRDGIRLGAGFESGGIGGVAVTNNVISSSPRLPISDSYGDGSTVSYFCENNKYNGVAYSGAGCGLGSTRPFVTGANLTCSKM